MRQHGVAFAGEAVLSSDRHCGVPVHRLFSDQYEYQDFTDGKGACHNRMSRMKTAPYETGIMLTEFATITVRCDLIETDRPWFATRAVWRFA